MAELLRFEDGLCIASTNLTPLVSQHSPLTVKRHIGTDFSKQFHAYLAYLKPKICGTNTGKNRYFSKANKATVFGTDPYSEAGEIIAAKAKTILARYV